MCGKVCVAASRGGVKMGSGCGGEALTEMQRSKNPAKERCVAASASMADIRSLVTVRVGPACGLVALCVTCGQDTELEVAVPCDSRVEADICTGDGEAAPDCNCWRECNAESGLPVQ